MKKKAPVVAIALAVLAALLATTADSQVFCRSQFNLANEACSMRSLIPGPGLRRGGLPPLRRRPQQQRLLNETSVAAAGASQGLQSARSNEDDDDDDDSYGEGERRSSRHRHQHQHRHSEDGDGEEDPRDTACCRRLMGLDNSCVCQAAARLPPFMTAVRHSVTLKPIDGCEICFECPGSLF